MHKGPRAFAKGPFGGADFTHRIIGEHHHATPGTRSSWHQLLITSSATTSRNSIPNARSSILPACRRYATTARRTKTV